jgi:MFS family permease
LLLLSIGSLICALAGSMEVLIAGRLIQGGGGGAIFVTSQTILGDLFPVEKRARVQSAVALIAALGAALGPALGGWFVTHATWRWAFLISLPIAAASAAAFLYGFVDTARRSDRPASWRGTLLLTLALAALFLGIGKDRLHPGLLALAAALAVPFFLLERRAARPILPPDLFRNPAFSLAALTVCFVSGVMVAYMAFLPLYLQGVVGLSPAAAGYLQGVPLTISLTICTFFVGKLIKRHGYRPALRMGACTVLAATLASALAAWLQAAHPGSAASFVLVALGQVFLGASQGTAITAAFICVQNQVEPARRGTATAGLQLVRGLGNTLTPAILGVVYLASLRARDLGLEPEQFLNQKTMSRLDPTALETARAGLGSSLRTLLPLLVGIGLLAVVTSLFFPRAVTDLPEKRT